MKTSDIANKLREQILLRHFEPGFHMQEIPLARMFGVSRTPVRSALASLTQEGFLEYAPKRGFRIRSFKLKDLEDAWELRGTLEGLACRIVAAEPNQKTLIHLRSLLDAADTLMRRGRLNKEESYQYHKINIDFHKTIINASENRFLIEFVNSFYNLPLTTQLIDMFYDGSKETLDLDRMKRGLDDHLRIVDAFEERNARRAENIMIEHIHASGRYLFKRVVKWDATVSGPPMHDIRSWGDE